MLLPIRDDNPHTTKPFVNYALIASCIAVFLWQNGLDEGASEFAAYAYGLVPGRISGQVKFPNIEVPAIFTLVTHMFMHGGWMHLIGNMWFLWIFGDNVEASLGHKRYLIFYLACGLAAAEGQFSLNPASDIPMIGASGAISGVLGAYLILHPRSNIKVFVLLIIFFTFVNMPAWIVLGFYFLMQLWSEAGTTPDEPGVAFMAHIAGFVAGAAMVFFFRKPQVSVFQPAHSRPFATETHRVGFRRRIPNVDRDSPWK